ncbi:MAG: Do family serine endopeptidase [Rhodothermales bacterium]
MDRPRRIPHTSILIGIGLVLIGLLGGILVMLFVVDVPPQRTVVPRVVERVELGSAQPMPSRSVPDSGDGAASVDMLSLNRLFKDVAEHVTPAVVYIQVDGQTTRDVPREWFHNFDDEELDDQLFRDIPRQSVGSGVIISKQGFVVTNHHVVDRARRIQVTLSDKRQFSASVVGIDPSTDLAVIQLENPENLPVTALGDSDEVEVGEWVLAIGNPFRLTSTVTAGIVSALGRQVRIIDDPLGIEDFIQTDAAINPGNSGGALVNLQGELIGISTAIATESGSYEGYGFAVPVNLMERVVRDLIAFGEVQRGYLGVTIRGIDAAAAGQLGLDQIGGVYLLGVERDGAADRGGLHQGDVVISVEGHQVNAPNELQSVIARHRPGDRVSLEVWRQGTTRHLQVELQGKEQFRSLEPTPTVVPEGSDSSPTLDVFQLEGWGVGLRTVTDRERDGFDLEDGVYLAYVEKGTVADSAGLPRDVVIERINGEAVASVEDAVRLFAQAAEASETVLVRVRRRSGLAAFYELDVPERE